MSSRMAGVCLVSSLLCPLNLWKHSDYCVYSMHIYGLSVSQQSLIACWSCRVRAFWEFPYFGWHVSWCCNYVGFLSVTILLRFHDCSFPVVCRRRHLTADIWFSASYSLFAPSSAVCPEPVCKDHGVDASCGDGSSTVSCSLHSDQVCISEITSICSRRALLRRGLGGTLTRQ